MGTVCGVQHYRYRSGLQNGDGFGAETGAVAALCSGVHASELDVRLAAGAPEGDLHQAKRCGLRASHAFDHHQR